MNYLSSIGSTAVLAVYRKIDSFITHLNHNIQLVWP